MGKMIEQKLTLIRNTKAKTTVAEFQRVAETAGYLDQGKIRGADNIAALLGANINTVRTYITDMTTSRHRRTPQTFALLNHMPIDRLAQVEEKLAYSSQTSHYASELVHIQGKGFGVISNIESEGNVTIELHVQ